MRYSSESISPAASDGEVPSFKVAKVASFGTLIVKRASLSSSCPAFATTRFSPNGSIGRDNSTASLTPLPRARKVIVVERGIVAVGEYADASAFACGTATLQFTTADCPAPTVIARVTGIVSEMFVAEIETVTFCASGVELRTIAPMVA